MREYNPCMGCEYYNKPYWSIISPCNSCPRIYGTDNFVTTDTTNIKMEKYNNITTNLPTAKVMDRKLLEAKNAIFKMIAQFHHPTMFDDGELIFLTIANLHWKPHLMSLVLKKIILN